MVLYYIKQHEGGITTKSNAGYLMSRIRHLGNRAFNRYLAQSGVDGFNGAQGRILYVLWEHGPMPITGVGRLTSLAKTTLTSMLDRMEEGGLIVRTPGPRDRRQVTIELTPGARALRTEYDRVSDRTNELYYKGFSERELRAFEGYLGRILRNLEEDETKTGGSS